MKSDLLNKKFSDVYTKENLTSVPAPKPTLGSLIVTLPGVIKQLTSLKPNKASGPDEIPPWFLKEYAHEIGLILTAIYQASINFGIVPFRWKYAHVCGVFKSGEKSDPCNYRPISLTCIASKVLEHIVHSHVMKHLDSHQILTDEQHGFRAKRSTVTQLITTIHDLAKTIEDNKSVHAAILDFSKAFDKVPHQRLLHKLEYYGIRENLLKWFESFLTGRTQSVICDGSRSNPTMVSSGVPQGTVLGPLLFLLYVNDLPENLQSSVRLFADDALLYGIISSEDDCDKLQADLSELECWQDRWPMKFNPSKCKIISISTKKSPPLKKYVFCGSELEEVDSVSYLGVTLTKNLKWSQHVSSISGKASKVLGLIKRNFWNCPRSVKETAYTTLVRPKLEYGCEAWDPHFKKDISSLEHVQRKAARFCLNNYQPTASVTEMLSELGWSSLETRRTIARLNLMYKICHGNVDIDKNSYLCSSKICGTRTRSSHDYKFFNINATKDVYFYSFFPRTLRVWNKLPKDVVDSNSLEIFKTKISKYFIEQF